MIPAALRRYRHLGVQVARFAIIGVGATLTHVVIVLMLVENGLLRPFWANFLAFSTALFVTYFGNHQWVFELRGDHGHHFPKFIVIALLGLALNQGIVYLVVDSLGWDYRISLFLVITAVPAITFALNRFWAFRRGGDNISAPDH